MEDPSLWEHQEREGDLFSNEYGGLYQELFVSWNGTQHKKSMGE